MLEQINVTIHPLVVSLGPATACSGKIKGRAKITFQGRLTRQAKRFWGNAVLQVYRNHYTLLVSTAACLSMLETAPEISGIDPNGGYPIAWMRKYKAWVSTIREMIPKVDKVIGVKDAENH